MLDRTSYHDFHELAVRNPDVTARDAEGAEVAQRRIANGRTINMPLSIELERRLRWADADAAGRLHFPRIFELVEEAESELVRSIEWPMNRSMGYDFPRAHVDCRFLRVLMLDAPFRLRLTVGKLGRTSIRYDFHVFDADEELAIEGSMTVVVVQNGKPTEIPPTLRAALSRKDSLTPA